jgi:hypothetical protein
MLLSRLSQKTPILDEQDNTIFGVALPLLSASSKASEVNCGDLIYIPISLQKNKTQPLPHFTSSHTFQRSTALREWCFRVRHIIPRSIQNENIQMLDKLQHTLLCCIYTIFKHYNEDEAPNALKFLQQYCASFDKMYKDAQTASVKINSLLDKLDEYVQHEANFSCMFGSVDEAICKYAALMPLFFKECGKPLRLRMIVLGSVAHEFKLSQFWTPTIQTQPGKTYATQIQLNKIKSVFPVKRAYMHLFTNISVCKRVDVILFNSNQEYIFEFGRSCFRVFPIVKSTRNIEINIDTLRNFCVEYPKLSVESCLVVNEIDIQNKFKAPSPGRAVVEEEWTSFIVRSSLLVGSRLFARFYQNSPTDHSFLEQ